MKFRLFTLVAVFIFSSCNSENKVTKTKRQVTVNIKSNILLESSAYQSFSNPDRKDYVYLTISGETILEGKATLKAVNTEGEEIHCMTFSSKDLIQPEYRTANSTLKEAHIREVVEGFFVRTSEASLKNDKRYAGI